MKRAFALSAVVLAASLWGMPSADACGGGFAPAGSGLTMDPNRNVAIHFDGKTERYVFDVGFCGSASDFGLILPIPVPPSAPPTVSGVTFSSLHEAATPARCSSSSGGGCGSSDGALGFVDRSPGQGGVSIYGEGKVSAFDYVILGATDVKDLESWLDANHYNYTESARQVYANYVAKKWVFVAFKIDASKLDGGAPSSTPTPNPVPDAGTPSDSGGADSGELPDGGEGSDGGEEGGVLDAGAPDADAPDASIEPTMPPRVCGTFGPIELSFATDRAVVPTHILAANEFQTQTWTLFTVAKTQLLPAPGSAHFGSVKYSAPLRGSETLLGAAGERLTAVELKIVPNAEDLVLESASDADVGASCPEEEDDSSCAIRSGGGSRRSSSGRSMEALSAGALAAFVLALVRGRRRRS